MDDNTARVMSKKIDLETRATSGRFPNIPESTLHYLCARLEDIKTYDMNSQDKCTAEVNFMNGIEALSGKYAINENEEFYKHFIDNYVYASTYKERNMWSVH